MRLVGPSILVGIASFTAACASQELVRADDMSAAQHRAEAQRTQAAAGDAGSARGDGGAVPPGDYDQDRERRHEAANAREHARQHAAAAQFLEQFEDEQCVGLDRSSRAACPLLGPLVRLEDVPGGVRVTFADRTRVPAAIAGMRCHHAYARTRHFEETAACPLYVSGIDFRPGLDPRSVEIVARDEKTVRLIRARSREQAIFAPPERR